MRRGTKSRLLAACALALLATAALAPSALAAGPAAVEEYVLTLPGVDTSGVGKPDPLVSLAQRAGPSGVTGERQAAETPLAATVGAALSPAGLALFGVAAIATVLALRRGRSAR